MKAVEFHTPQELIAEQRPKSYREILKTIQEQHARPGGMERREQYLTLYLAAGRGHLVSPAEPIVYEQYPLRKRPPDPPLVDIIYAYEDGDAWRVGVVEAKVGGGTFLDAALDQARAYLDLLRADWPVHREIIRDLARRQVLDCRLDADCTIGRLDILATASWWAVQPPASSSFQGLAFRALEVPDDFCPVEGPFVPFGVSEANA